MILKAALAAGALLLTASLAFTATLYVQGRRKPDRTGQYVALGSSFAAGYGLGARAPGSPLACMRSANGYPRELAGLTGLALVDMSCSGSTTEHLLNGGQVFLGPQLDAVGPATKLVTITSGGNDVNYIGDLTLASGSLGLLGKIPKLVWKGPAPLADRDFAKVKKNLREIVVSIKSRAPTP